MKHLLVLAGIALMAAACTGNDEPVQGYGQINLSLGNTVNPEIEVSTRAYQILSTDEAKDYWIEVLQNGKSVLEPTNYLNFMNTNPIFPSGEGYAVAAQSCTEEEAQTANGGAGQVRYTGTSDAFAIAVSSTSDVTVSCTMANAKVSIVYDEEFTKYFTDYKVTVYEASNESRKIEFDANGKYTPSQGGSAYDAVFFNIDQDPTLKCEISGTYKGILRKAGTTVNLEAAKWYKLKVKISPSGHIDLNIGVDNTVTDTEVDVEVNPYV